MFEWRLVRPADDPIWRIVLGRVGYSGEPAWFNEVEGDFTVEGVT